MIVVGSGRSMGQAAGRQHRPQNLFGGRLADRTRDADDLRLRTRASGDAQTHHRLERVLNREDRTESRERRRALARYDGRRGAGFESASDMIVTVMSVAANGEEKVAWFEGPAVNRDARDTRAERRARRG